MMIRPLLVRLGPDQLDDAGAQRDRGDEEAAVLPLAAVAGQVVEEVGQVLAELGVRREQPDVLVEPGGLGVVVAGAHVAVAADPGAGAANHEGRLGVRLETDDAVHDMDAGLLQLGGPGDVRLLVEARGQLDERDHLLARTRRRG